MKVSIIGQGYVGLTISVFAAEHHTVVGFDKNQGVVDALNSGRSHIEGVASAGAVAEIAHRVGIEVPVIEAVGEIVSEQLTPAAALQKLMEITTKAENFIR